MNEKVVEKRISGMQVEDAVKNGVEYLFSIQRESKHWCGELESNATITAEYVYLNQILGRDPSARAPEMIRYFQSAQNSDGSFGIAQNWKGDVSSTAEVYLALRILGVDLYDPMLTRAQSYILKNGGMEKVRVFTRIHFALFGLVPWDAIPALPPEAILLPPQSPVNVYALSSWARGTMVPLFILFHYRPVFALPNGKSKHNDWLDHLWLNSKNKNVPYSSPWTSLLRQYGISARAGLKHIFNLSDRLLKHYERIHVRALRKRAIERCVRFILEHQEASGDWGGIFPPMFNGIVALLAHGYSPEADEIRRGIQAVDAFAWRDERGFRIQACVSPVWDTALAAIGLLDSGVSGSDSRVKDAIQWLLDRQINTDYGDWKVYRPNLISGGWAFEYHNTWYPDVDDTAAVMLAILKQDPSSAAGESIRRAAEWVLGMQNRDGGWAAFDVNNNREFLNEIPFADIDALCDQSCPDITGRVIEAFSQMLVRLPPTDTHADLRFRIEAALQEGLRYLESSQEETGPWFGRWGVNYIYGTSNVLCGLAAQGVLSQNPMVRRALPWLIECQNDDGGWGESVASYQDKSFMGRGSSTPSQTAWALMGLLSYLPPEHPAIQRGVHWLLQQAKGGTWKDEHFTGTGFPKHFYLRYHLYAHYFPMMALGRYLEAVRA